MELPTSAESLSKLEEEVKALVAVEKNNPTYSAGLMEKFDTLVQAKTVDAVERFNSDSREFRRQARKDGSQEEYYNALLEETLQLDGLLETVGDGVAQAVGVDMEVFEGTYIQLMSSDSGFLARQTEKQANLQARMRKNLGSGPKEIKTEEIKQMLKFAVDNIDTFTPPQSFPDLPPEALESMREKYLSDLVFEKFGFEQADIIDERMKELAEKDPEIKGYVQELQDKTAKATMG